MKRSQINQIIREGIAFCEQMNFKLPPFGYWKADQWQGRGAEWDEIRDNMLGWDCTDFGSNDYANVGLLLFTIRNGNLKLTEKYEKPYCEKLMIIGEDQYCPCHYHFNKMEDIINRGGGNLLLKLWWKDDQEGLSDKPVQVSIDGHRVEVEAGSVVRLTPGESITLPSYLYHTFWAEQGQGQVLSGEVSKVNDDVTDNRFLEELPRFSAIEEDEAAEHLLCNEYPR
ncbi:MAG: D-lyxose/D-mannose family sugar isomerase [Armatimonadia bacterium]